MEIHRISRKRYLHTVWWAVLGSCLIVAVVATLGRATINFDAALTDKPDVAIYVLLPDAGLKDTTLLRDKGNERHYLAETASGSKLVILRKGDEEWYVAHVEDMR